MPASLELLKQLIQCPSLTPNDAGCQAIISDRLRPLGFTIENMRFGDVDNLWARHGTQSPLMVFAGHTDVVPTGPLEEWQSAPFTPTVRDGKLYGRGAADMKSGLAAMIVAAEQFIQKNPHYKGSIAFLITSDEEGPTNLNGTKRVVETLVNRGEKMDYCIVGEASSEKTLGDQIRIGRRGSLSGRLTIHGKQGHVAFPENALNPIHAAAPFLKELTNVQWDQGNEFFPPTTFQISNIHAGTGAANVIPGVLEILFNFRFSTAMTVDNIQSRVNDLIQKHALKTDLQWALSGLPFLTKQGALIKATQEAIFDITNTHCKLSTGGGTSDGRFIAPTGTEVIELGPINASIHQINEHVSMVDLALLTNVYQRILEKLFAE